MNHLLRSAMVVQLLLVPATVASHPQDSGARSGPDAERGPVFIEARAEEMLRSMCGHLAAVEAFRVRVEVHEDEPHPSGQWVQIRSTSDLVVHRRHGIRASKRGDIERTDFWTDLRTAAMLDDESRSYAQVEVPGTLDAAIEHLIDRYGISWPLADLCFTDPYDRIAGRVQVGSYVGLHAVDGRDCHHLAFRNAEVDWQVWIDAGVEPLLRKLVIVDNGIEGAPRYTAHLSAWELEPALPPELFRFTIPEDAERIEVQPLRSR